MALSGYGYETWCLSGYQSGRFARGPTVVVQAAFRRLTTPRGTLRGGDEEAAYGLDIAGYVGDVGPEAAARALPGLIRGELLKDDRIADVAVAATSELAPDGTGVILLEIGLALVDEDQTFSLTLRVTDVSVSVLFAGAA